MNERVAIGQGFKPFMDKANKGFKHVPSDAKRGHKFIQENIKSIVNADALARKAANTLHGAEEYAEMGSWFVGVQEGETLHQPDEYMTNMGVAYTNLGEES